MVCKPLILNGGADRDRTDDLLNAIQALSQLSYSPDGSRKLSPGFQTVKSASRPDPDATASRKLAVVPHPPHGMFGRPPAGVAELAYAGHSKCPGPCGLVGSNPTSGTNVWFSLSSSWLPNDYEMASSWTGSLEAERAHE